MDLGTPNGKKESLVASRVLLPLPLPQAQETSKKSAAKAPHLLNIQPTSIFRSRWVNSQFLSLFSMADEELVDPKKYLEERCQPRCVKPLYEYRECVKRIKDDETGHKHCTGQYFDYWKCVDNCVAEKLFDKLK